MQKLSVKDLINVGIYTAVYFLVIFMIAMMGFVPILLIVGVAIEAVFGTIVYMVYLTKVEKFGMLTITGILLGCISFVSGRPIATLFISIAAGVLADLAWKKGNYKSVFWGIVSACCMFLWIAGFELPMFFQYRDNYMESLRGSYGDAYVDTLLSLTPNWMFFGMIGLGIIGSIIGGVLGKRILTKHFEKLFLAEE